MLFRFFVFRFFVFRFSCLNSMVLRISPQTTLASCLIQTRGKFTIRGSKPASQPNRERVDNTVESIHYSWLLYGRTKKGRTFRHHFENLDIINCY